MEKKGFVLTNDIGGYRNGGMCDTTCTKCRSKTDYHPFKVATLDSCQSAKAGHERAGPGKRPFECVGHQQARL